ncbi:hypothetical protein [Holospora curviuscula]|uniref:Uncharacterized protein n=1 Tax=Holospora curviuscula TaxID=1082868 RepID=A0A2S5RHX6_9PROT|nr:hypothetical protein [Holospora curviuscula]PPE06934.1 hypothetical protein HCUR_00041 [Holospora curviuscula]
MDKSNKITTLPKVLDWLNSKGSILTIGAMGCHYKIMDKEEDYIGRVDI